MNLHKQLEDLNFGLSCKILIAMISGYIAGFGITMLPSLEGFISICCGLACLAFFLPPLIIYQINGDIISNLAKNPKSVFKNFIYALFAWIFLMSIISISVRSILLIIYSCLCMVFTLRLIYKRLQFPPLL